jgi:hypothetical protein
MEYTKSGAVPIVLPNKDEFEEIEGETLIQFTALGQSISGKVLGVAEGSVKGQRVMELKLRTNTGNVKLFMNHDLRAKILPDDVGRVVVIIYDDDEDTGKESRMKIFRVFRRKPESKAATPKAVAAPTTRTDSDPGITDDDIPF